MNRFKKPEYITFLQLESWDYPKRKVYQYAFVSDKEISKAIASGSVENHDLGIEWYCINDNTSTRKDNPIHIERIAKIVIELRAGTEFEPININAENYETCGYCVTDGHHRLRAYKYLNYKGFKAIFSGDKQAIEKLKGN